MDYLNRFMLVVAALTLVACAAPQEVPETGDGVTTVEDAQTVSEVAEDDAELPETEQDQIDAVEENLDSSTSTDVAGSGDADNSAVDTGSSAADADADSSAAGSGVSAAGSGVSATEPTLAATQPEVAVTGSNSVSDSSGSAAEPRVAAEPEPEPAPIARPTLPAQLQGAEQLLEQKSFFFDFDMEALKDDAFDALDAHAAAIGLAIAENPGLIVTIEGHADERGTQEYNIALGMRRAESVSRYLRAKGIPAANLSTVSFGEAKPVELGSDEVSWAANRRAVLDY